MNTIIIGIAGGTGSGKTTLTERLRDHFGIDEVSVINHDSYYKRHDELPYEERCKLNYDHPDSFDTPLMVAHLRELRAGHPVQVPVYDYTIHNRSNETVLVRPAPVIIVEGILIFDSPELCDLMDMKVFVDTDADVRILRRIVRDVKEGVIDTLTASGRAEVAATVYSVATPENARAETLTMLARHPEINVLISFNEAVSVGAAQAVSDLDRADDLWMVAFDSNITTVDALHTGAVDAMVVQNTYGMGYFSVENVYKLLAGQGNDVTRETETATRIIDRSNIFALDGQKAVFPFE